MLEWSRRPCPQPWQWFYGTQMRGPPKNNLAQFPQVSSLVTSLSREWSKNLFSCEVCIYIYIYRRIQDQLFFGRPTVVQPLMYIHLSRSAGQQSLVSHHDNWITFNLKPRHFIGFRSSYFFCQWVCFCFDVPTCPATNCGSLPCINMIITFVSHYLHHRIAHSKNPWHHHKNPGWCSAASWEVLCRRQGVYIYIYK